MAETKVILTKTVSNLGHSGDVVDVKSGYARNYLFPQGLAFAWTKGAEAQIVAMKRARLAKAVATREDAVAAKAAIEGTTVEIAAKVSESGKLFGGISNEAIAVALSDKAAVNPKAIEVETIKTTGDFPAKVALHPEITASFFVKAWPSESFRPSAGITQTKSLSLSIIPRAVCDRMGDFVLAKTPEIGATRRELHSLQI